MRNYDSILMTAIYSIPIFAILGIYFFINVMFSKQTPNIKKIIYPAGILVILTIIIPWPYLRITTGALAFILLWCSMFFCTSKKDVIRVGLAITFIMFPAFILLCFFKSMGWAFNHSGMQPHIHAICSILIYLGVIWIPALIKCTFLNVKSKEEKTLTEKPNNKTPENEISPPQNPSFSIPLPSIMFIIVLIFIATSALRWSVKLEGNKYQGRRIKYQGHSIFKEESFDSKISLATINAGFMNSFYIAISPKKNNKLKISWDKSSYSIDGEDQGKNPFAYRASTVKNRLIILLNEQDISTPLKIIIFPKDNYHCKKFQPLENLERGAFHCIKLVIISNGKEYIHTLKVKINRTVRSNLLSLFRHPLELFNTIIRIPLIIVLLTVVIIYKSNSPNIKIILALAAANLFFLSLWNKENLIFVLITSFILYLISAWLSNKNKDIFAILAMNLLIIIPIFRSISYFYIVYFNNTRIDKNLWTTIIIVLLLAVTLVTAYIKYSKIKVPCEELENKTL